MRHGAAAALAVMLWQGAAVVQAREGAGLRVCAEPQFYAVVHELQDLADPPFTAVVDTTTVLEAGLANQALRCDLVLTGFSALSVMLMRGGRVHPAQVQVIAHAPLVVAARDRQLFRHGVDAITERRLRSLAVPRAAYSAVGHAAARIIRSPAFPTGYLENDIYRADQEFQVLAMLDSRQVQAGFVTLPLLHLLPWPEEYSYWKIPATYYPPLPCLAMIPSDSTRQELAARLMEALLHHPRVRELLERRGFGPRAAAALTGAQPLPGWGRQPASAGRGGRQGAGRKGSAQGSQKKKKKKGAARGSQKKKSGSRSGQKKNATTGGSQQKKSSG